MGKKCWARRMSSELQGWWRCLRAARLYQNFPGKCMRLSLALEIPLSLASCTSAVLPVKWGEIAFLAERHWELKCWKAMERQGCKNQRTRMIYVFQPPCPGVSLAYGSLQLTHLISQGLPDNWSWTEVSWVQLALCSGWGVKPWEAFKCSCALSTWTRLQSSHAQNCKWRPGKTRDILKNPAWFPSGEVNWNHIACPDLLPYPSCKCPLETSWQIINNLPDVPSCRIFVLTWASAVMACEKPWCDSRKPLCGFTPNILCKVLTVIPMEGKGQKSKPVVMN